MEEFIFKLGFKIYLWINIREYGLIVKIGKIYKLLRYDGDYLRNKIEELDFKWYWIL